jgi:hypothetical protein
MAMFQGILGFAATENTKTGNTETTSTQEVDLGVSLVEEGDSEGIHMSSVVLENAGGFETQVLSDKLGTCNLAAQWLLHIRPGQVELFMIVQASQIHVQKQNELTVDLSWSCRY